MTWLQSHSLSFAQSPSLVLATHVEWMTKPHFMSYIEPICGGLVFISANEEMFVNSVWLS